MPVLSIQKPEGELIIMLSRQFALLCALAILGSLFLPWVITPIGSNLVPWDVLPAFERPAIEEYVRAAPPQVLVFLGSFVLAALFALLSLIGRETRLVALLTGALPVGLVGWAVYSVREQLNLAELEMTGEDLWALFQQASDALGTGGWAWIGGAALLFLLGLFDPGRAKPKPVVTSSRW
jgi:hypothetical protein